jgi:hypothetical protein
MFVEYGGRILGDLSNVSAVTACGGDGSWLATYKINPPGFVDRPTYLERHYPEVKLKFKAQPRKSWT